MPDIVLSTDNTKLLKAHSHVCGSGRGNKLVTDEMIVMYRIQQRFQKDLISSSWGKPGKASKGM